MVPIVHRTFRIIRLCATLFLLAASNGAALANAARAPTSEFGIPYRISLLDDGAVMQIAGSYSWALPQNLQAVLASSPNVRTVWLESPGGLIKPAIEVADILKQHHLDTFVARQCTSACTIVFLAGSQRSLGPDAKLGFHQAYAPDGTRAELNAVLKVAYDTYRLPAAFIARVLQTPHTDMWYPSPDMLRSLKLVNAAPSDAMLAIAAPQSPRLRDLVGLLAYPPDDGVARFAEVLCDLLRQLQDVSPVACWGFAHQALDEPDAALSLAMAERVKAAQALLAQGTIAASVAGPDAETRDKVARDLIEQLKADGRLAGLAGLRTGASPETFCPALRDLLLAALTVPAPRRALTVRAVLSGV